MGSNGDTMRSGVWFAFGPFRFDASAGLLFRNAEPLKLRRKTLDVLAYLLEHAGSVLTREEILKAVWADVIVQPEIVTTSIAELRQALADSRKSPRYVETLHGRGFRFVAKVRVSKPAIRERNGVQALVGRQAQVASILSTFDEVFAGAKRTLLVSGPAGIGKSRLLQEAAAHMRARGAQVLRARAEHASQHSAFWIWTQLIHDFAQTATPAELRARLGSAAGDIAAVVPSLQDRLHDITVIPGLDPELARARFFDGVVNFIRSVGERRPLVFIIDDLHKEGASGLALLQAVLADARIHRLFVLAAYRSGEESKNLPFKTMIEAWRLDEVLTNVAVPGLSQAEAHQLIEQAVESRLPAALIDRIVHDSYGNPYFVLEILKWLRTHAPANVDVGAKHYEIPHTVQRVIQDRLKDCSEAAYELLRAAALLGGEFDVRVAAHVGGLDRPTLARAVADALDQGMLVETEDKVERLRFAHDLLRETILRAMPGVEKADFHYRIGLAIEALGVNDSLLPELAYHFSRSAGFGDDDKAIHYCLRAGRQAHERYFNAQARELLRRALELADRRQSQVDEQTFEILEMLAEVESHTDQRSEVQAIVDRMRAVAEAYDNPLWLARAAVATASRSYMPERAGRGEQYAADLERALANLPADNSALRARVAVSLAIALFTRPGTEKRRIELAQLAASISRTLTDRNERGYILRDVVIAFWDSDHLPDRTALADELRAVALAAGNRYLECEAVSWQALSLLAGGRLKELQKFYDGVKRMLVETNMPATRLYVWRIEIVRHVFSGRLAEAQRLLDEYATVKARSGNVLDAEEPLEPLLLNLTIQRELGLPAELALMVRDLAERFPHLPMRQSLPQLLLEAGLRSEAEHAFAIAARDDFKDMPPRNEANCWLPGLFLLCDACADLGDVRQSQLLYDMLRPYAGLWAVVFYCASLFGCIERVLARLAGACRQLGLAEAHYAQALAVCEREGAVTELTRTQLDYAETLEALAPERADEARRWRVQALERAQQHGLQALHRRAERTFSSATHTSSQLH